MLEFDRKKQQEFVLGAHKRKLKRKEEGAKAAKKALRQQFLQEKRLRFEDARAIYNMNCQVPILADNRLANQPDVATWRKMQAKADDDDDDEGVQAFTKDHSTKVLVTTEPLTPKKSVDTSVAESSSAVRRPGKFAVPETLHAPLQSLQKRGALRKILASKPKPSAAAKPGKGGKAVKTNFDANKFRRQMRKGPTGKSKGGKSAKSAKGGKKGKGKGKKR